MKISELTAFSHLKQSSHLLIVCPESFLPPTEIESLVKVAKSKDISVSLQTEDSISTQDSVTLTLWIDEHGRINTPETAEKICALKNLYCHHIIVLTKPDTPWQSQKFLSLAFRSIGTLTLFESVYLAYEYDIESYNRKRSWNTPKNWANPENFHKFRW